MQPSTSRSRSKAIQNVLPTTVAPRQSRRWTFTCTSLKTLSAIVTFPSRTGPPSGSPFPTAARSPPSDSPRMRTLALSGAKCVCWIVQPTIATSPTPFGPPDESISTFAVGGPSAAWLPSMSQPLTWMFRTSPPRQTTPPPRL